MKTQTFCSCCHELITEEVVRTDAYNDGEEADYCSWECVGRACSRTTSRVS